MSASHKRTGVVSGLYVKFEPERQAWKVPHSLPLLTNTKISAAYTRAHRYFIKRANKLDKGVAQLGWKKFKVREPPTTQQQLQNSGHVAGVQNIVVIQRLGTSSKEQPDTLALPYHFDDFLHPQQFTGQTPTGKTPRDPFGWYALRCRGGLKVDAYARLDESEPVANIFRMLQCIAPGMLQLVEVHRSSSSIPGPKDIVHSVPPTFWIQNNKDVLVTILGSEQRVSALIKAASRTVVHLQGSVVPTAPNPRRQILVDAGLLPPSTSNPEASSSETSSVGRSDPQVSQTSNAKKQRRKRERKHKSGGSGWGGNSFRSDCACGDALGLDFNYAACDKDCGWCGGCMAEFDN